MLIANIVYSIVKGKPSSYLGKIKSTSLTVFKVEPFIVQHAMPRVKIKMQFSFSKF